LILTESLSSEEDAIVDWLVEIFKLFLSEITWHEAVCSAEVGILLPFCEENILDFAVAECFLNDILDLFLNLVLCARLDTLSLLSDDNAHDNVIFDDSPVRIAAPLFIANQKAGAVFFPKGLVDLDKNLGIAAHFSFAQGASLPFWEFWTEFNLA
jgi:hypothetical protein